MIDDAIAGFARSGFLRNASITGGAGLTIKDGGRLALETASGVVLFEIGPVGPAMPDGTIQQGLVIRRADGTPALAMFDANTSDGVLRQAANWYDRGGNVVLADDTDSGQGIARPWLSGAFSRTRFADMSVTTTSSTFETLWDTTITKQQPRLQVGYRATMDTSGTTGETRVLVNDVQIGPVATEGFVVASRYVGPAAVAGAHMSDLTIKIQGRRTSGSGALRVEPLGWRTQQA
ncbi:hypothetical protein DQ240_18510 [Blastococcus sp. TF02A-26]|nr:hypothetical protein DQ240_18510 [Blastococcus sp. TF02A-26]